MAAELPDEQFPGIVQIILVGKLRAALLIVPEEGEAAFTHGCLAFMIRQSSLFPKWRELPFMCVDDRARCTLFGTNVQTW